MSLPGTLAATYSLIIHNAEAGLIGAAVQSHYLGVGSTVPWLQSGVGGVMTQAMVNVSYGPKGLALLGEGAASTDVVDCLTGADAQRALRQLIVMDVHGEAAVHTGADCIVHAEHAIAQRDGTSVAAAANMMDRSGVPTAMVEAVLGVNSSEVGTDRMVTSLLAALEAAEQHGGDIRGRQSAAIVVVAATPETDVEQSRPFDIRVEDHPEPLVELRRLVDLSRAYTAEYGGRDSDQLDSLSARSELRFWHALDAMVAGDENNARRGLHGLDEEWLRLATRIPETGIYALDAPAWNRLISPEPAYLYHIANLDVSEPIPAGPEGFVHCSFAHQLPRVTRRHFPDIDDPIVLELDPDRIDAPVVVEDSYELGEVFPHIYGALNPASIVRRGTLSKLLPWLYVERTRLQ